MGKNNRESPIFFITYSSWSMAWGVEISVDFSYGIRPLHVAFMSVGEGWNPSLKGIPNIYETMKVKTDVWNSILYDLYDL